MREGGRSPGGVTVRSFRPPFEDDAWHSHVSVPVYRAVHFCLFISSQCLRVCSHFVCVFIFACSCVCARAVYVH